MHKDWFQEQGSMGEEELIRKSRYSRDEKMENMDRENASISASMIWLLNHSKVLHHFGRGPWVLLRQMMPSTHYESDGPVVVNEDSPCCMVCWG